MGLWVTVKSSSPATLGSFILTCYTVVYCMTCESYPCKKHSICSTSSDSIRIITWNVTNVHHTTKSNQAILSLNLSQTKKKSKSRMRFGRDQSLVTQLSHQFRTNNILIGYWIFNLFYLLVDQYIYIYIYFLFTIK